MYFFYNIITNLIIIISPVIIIYRIFRGKEEIKRVGEKFCIYSQKKINKGGFKNWLGGSINISGSIKIDDGAIKALQNGASLLPSGIKKISGNFSKGDIVEILSENGKKLGRGISYYDSSELNLIKGKKSIYIKDTLGYEGREEIIHRDYLFLNLNFHHLILFYLFYL